MWDSRLATFPLPQAIPNHLIKSPAARIARPDFVAVPSLIVDSGENAWRRYVEFFTAHIRNRNTRAAYARAVSRFCTWCANRGVRRLEQVSPVIVASYIEELGHKRAAPTVKLALAAIRMLFDFLVTGQVIPINPAASVRGPKHVVKKGKTTVLSAGEARQLLESIDSRTIAGLRDRALIAVMIYSFARVGAVVAMNVEDYFPQGRRVWFRFHEKGGQLHDVPAHHKAEEYVDAYIRAAGITGLKGAPIFRTLDRHKCLSENRMQRREVLAMIKRRAGQAGLPATTCCHTFRATGITAYLEADGQIEHAQRIACHESPRTTKLYDRTDDQVSLDEIERVRI